MATFRLCDLAGTNSANRDQGFWVNALTQDRARAVIARTFEPGSGPGSRWLDASRTTCIPDRQQAVPRGVISIGAFRSCA